MNLGDYFQENRTSQRPFLSLRISFPGRPIFIQLPPGPHHQDPQPGAAGRQLQAAQEGRQRGDYCTHYKYYDSEGFVVEFLENYEIFQSVKAILGGLLHQNSLKYLT